MSGLVLQQGIEVASPARRERMRRGVGIDRLARQHIQLTRALAQPLEMRQVRMKIEGRHALHQPRAVQFGGDFERRRRTIRQFCGTKAETIPNRKPQPGQKRNAEIAEALRAGMA